MLLLGIDLESGGDFNAPLEQNFITEIGMVLWDTEFSQPVEIYSTLLNHECALSPEAQEYTGITEALLKRHGVSPDIRVINPIKALMSKADFIVAHNGRVFDRPLLEAFFTRSGHKMPATEWLDTLHDIDYPRNCVSKNLTYLAAFHGILNCFQHRAVTDVLTMLTVMMRYNLDEIIANAHQPRLVIKAEVSYDDREKAKNKRFSWETPSGKDSAKYPKSWVRIVREDQLEAIKLECDFPVAILERLKAATES
ncbi:MAG: hypothetical protein KJ958_06790 [Gammaproteobacteria bacterium]|nr:hypothetical protein [Gammaproteobacteria bacterium]MBU1978863.1 hypothetical protein [Gammaproteobacteria bacterium]